MKNLSDAASAPEDAWKSWQLPDVGAAQAGGASGAPTAGGIEQIEQQAYDEGFARGRQDGLARFGEELQHRIAALDGILSGLAQPLERMDDTLAEDIADLAVIVARQLIRRELKTEPGQIVATVREAVAVLPFEAKRIRLFLHPDDIALLQDVLGSEESERRWELVPDATITRGGCRLDSDRAEVDATIEARIAGVAASVLGGERKTDPED